MRFKLFEQFIINDTLNKRLFDDNNKLKEDVRRALLNVAEDFIDTVEEKEIPIKVYDCWLVGSNASYNYTDKSDIDLHIIVDSSVEGITPELLRLLYDYAKSSYNDKHNITVKGQEVEVYLEDINSNAITNGIYSLKKDAWIKFPKKIEVRAYDVTNSEKYVELLHKYSSLTDDQIGDFIDELYMLRKESLAADGEFGEGNLIFKQLRNDGIIDELKDRLYAMKSKELTLENLGESLNEKLWYKVTDLDKSNPLDPFYFYGVDRNEAIDTLVNTINGGGTPKQQLDRKLLGKIRDKYKGKLTNANFSTYFNIYATSGKKLKNSDVLTLADRQIRTDNHVHANAANTAAQPPTKDYYLHHKDGKEYNNSFTNLVIIKKPKSENKKDIDAALADAAHRIIQPMGSITSISQTVDLYEFEPPSNTFPKGRWVSNHKVNIDVT